MTGVSVGVLRIAAASLATSLVGVVSVPTALEAQPVREERARGAEDLIAFAIENYFSGISLDSTRRRRVETIVRDHYALIQRLTTNREKNATLPQRRAKLRAVLRTDAERQQFDRNVTERKLP